MRNLINKPACQFVYMFVIYAALLIPYKIVSAEISTEEIVKKANHVSYYQGQNGRAKVYMTITDNQGRKRERQFTILRLDVEPEGKEGADGDQKFYVYFSRPADVNKMVFMVWKKEDGDDDRWLYLPALDLVKRIASTEKRTSFVGSDFFYEDVSGRSLIDDKHELVKSTDNFFVLKNTPLNSETVEFSHFNMWIHKGTFLPVKIEYFDKDGVKYREYEALKVDTVQEKPTVTKASMKDLKTGNSTVLEYSNVQYDMDIPDDIFTERYLRRPPVKYLR